VKLAVADSGTYGGSQYTTSASPASAMTSAKSPRVSVTSVRVSFAAKAAISAAGK
jgi:hypothetical protein